MLSITLQTNKKKYLAYNTWRKKFFLSQTPKEGEVILHLLPWLLSLNHPLAPGYVKELQDPFHVFLIENSQEILQKEFQYRKMFGIRDDRQTVRFLSRGRIIEGIYTIGSVGTISQTSQSDCDIWICIDRSAFSDEEVTYLNRKINLIKGWLDSQIRMPVYFFLTDVEDVRHCRFGHIDFESSGSAQKNILKEEFYRTSILICGKIPFWWVCRDDHAPVDYQEAFLKNQQSDIGEIDLIDFGDLTSVSRPEFYGAALWQLNKSLTHPLKSIIKMLLLRMFVESPEEDLLCHKFRDWIYDREDPQMPADPSLFTMKAVLDYYNQRARVDHFEFMKKCFYLRYEMKMLTGSQSLKEEVASEVFKTYKLSRKDIFALNEFNAWPLWDQIHFGGLMFEFVTDIYRSIVAMQKDETELIDPCDLTIIGRKISSSMDARAFKIPLLHISADSAKLPVLTFAHQAGLWQVLSPDAGAEPIIANEDAVFCLTYLVWNGIFDPVQIRMLPNHTPVTVQELINLGKTTRDVFGVYDIATVHFSRFLEEEAISRMLIVISFDDADFTMDIKDIRVVFKNNWEEMFVRRFSSLEKMRMFLLKTGKISPRMETFYYIQRNNKYYEKIIERAKNMIAQILAGR